ncbi:MAG: Hsp70 family protein, partial [Caldimonas sp.]
DDEVARMLSESFGAAEADMAERSLREAQVDADRLLAATAAALAADGDLLSAEARSRIDASTAGLREVSGGANRGVIDVALKTLAAATEDFAAERMNRGIRRALAGRRVEDV